ncbi:MAG: gluconate 2-dehydrogenase subunit 3 family protein [Tenacibaculum sp.]
MQRREALKNIALAFSSTIALPQLLSILHSCSAKQTNKKYLFLSQEQGKVISKISQVLLPSSNYNNEEHTDATYFLDHMFYCTVEDNQQKHFKKSSQAFNKTFLASHHKSSSKGSIKEFKVLIDQLLNISNKKQASVLKLLKTPAIHVAESKKLQYFTYSFITKVKYYCLFYYCSSKTYFNSQ